MVGGPRKSYVRFVFAALAFTAPWTTALELPFRCASPVVARALERAADLKPFEAEIVAASNQFYRVDPLLDLAQKENLRFNLSRRVYERVHHLSPRWTNVDERASQVVIGEITHGNLRQFSSVQIGYLSETLAEILRWRDRREEATRTSSTFAAHWDRTIRKRLEAKARETLRFERKRDHAISAQSALRRQFQRIGISVVSLDEEEQIGVPYLATHGDFRDVFERVVLYELFRDGRKGDWALCTAGDSLRMVLGHGDGEPSADLLAYDREHQSLWVIEIKRSPTALSHAVEQLIETKDHLRRARVRQHLSFGIALPRDLRLPESYREAHDGTLEHHDRAIHVEGRRVQVLRF